MKVIRNNVSLSALFLITLPKWLNTVDSIDGYFSCSNNELISLINCPKNIRGHFMCVNNKLMTLDGCPKEVLGNFYCGNNPGNFTEADVRKVCKVNGRVYCS